MGLLLEQHGTTVPEHVINNTSLATATATACRRRISSFIHKHRLFQQERPQAPRKTIVVVEYGPPFRSIHVQEKAHRFVPVEHIDGLENDLVGSKTAEDGIPNAAIHDAFDSLAHPQGFQRVQGGSQVDR